MLTLYLATTTGLTLTSFLLLKVVELKARYQEQEVKKQLSLETAKKRERQAKEKLHRAKIILQRIEQEFVIIFSTVDGIDRLSLADFQSRYENLWDKIAEAQMLLAFYTPTLKESLENLDNLLSDYWKKLYSVLVGEKVERRAQHDSEIVEYSQLIVTKISGIRQELAQLMS